MGIFIKLKIVPDKISVSAWDSTYKEAIKLIQAYPFLDIVSDETSYNCLWNYADSPSGRPIRYCNNNIGFRIFGDLITMEMAESFELIQDLRYYCDDSESEKGCADILQTYADNFQGIRSVFDAKTQGYDYHKYVLAIACLFENRLQPHAIALGDISRGQMEEAIEWANSILEQPIEISQRSNNEVLLVRIKKITPDELAALNMFMEATLNARDYQLGCFVGVNFSKESITKYYADKTAQYKIGTFGFSNIISEYLNMGNDLMDLCDIYLRKDRSTEAIELFIRKILDLGIHLEPQNNQRSQQMQLEIQRALQSDKPYSRNPDTINSLFGKLMVTIASGNQHQSLIYMPLDKIVEVFKKKFGSFYDVDALINECMSKTHEKQGSYPEALIQSPLLNDQKNDIPKSYDIENLDDLIFWESGLTIRPKLEAFILKVKEFVESEAAPPIEYLLENPSQNNKKNRMRYLIGHNKHFYISKKNWDYIEEKIEDINVFTKVARILFIEAEEIKINRLCLSLLNNMRLFEKFILYYTNSHN